MDGLFRVAAPAVLFKAAGRMVHLDPITLGVLASCESYLLLARGNPADDVEDYADSLGLDKDTRDRMRWKAYDELKADRALRIVTVHDMTEWLGQPEGIVHSAYWCLKGSGLKQFATVEAAEKEIRRAGPGWALSFGRARNHASGLDLLSGLDWPEPADDRPAAGAYKPIAWRRIYRSFADAFGWDKDTVNRMTLYDVKVYTADVKSLGGTTRLSHADLMARRNDPPGRG